MFKLDRKSEINKALIQRCVDKGLFDANYLQKSIDLELMALGRRITNRPGIKRKMDAIPGKPHPE